MCTNVVSINGCRNVMAEHKNDRNHAKSLRSSLNRQNSSKSLKSSNSSSMLQKKIQEHCFHRNTDEWNKERTYNERRKNKKLIRKQVDSKKQLKLVRLLYMPAALGLSLGVIMIFGATIRTISDGTVFWTYRQHFHVIGPVVLACGILFLLTATGLENYFTNRLKKAGVFKMRVHVHPDFQREAFYRRSSNVTFGSSARIEGDSINASERKRLASLDFSLSSSNSENTNNDLQSMWKRAMEVRLADDRSSRKSSTTSDHSVGSASWRALTNVPEIMITNAEDTLEFPENSTGYQTENINTAVATKSCKIKLPFRDISEESLIQV